MLTFFIIVIGIIALPTIQFWVGYGTGIVLGAREAGKEIRRKEEENSCGE